MPINVNLCCRSIKQTRAYYRNTLGFETIDTDMGTCTALLEDCSLIFFTADKHAPEPRFSGTFYLFVEDVENYYQSLLKKDEVRFEWPLQTMSYGTREFAITDCNGYRLAFAQTNRT